jgi:hypothetical protein
MYKTVTIRSRSSYWTNREQHEELEVDAIDLAKEIEDKTNDLEAEGWDVISIIPITSGNVSGGSGYYYTESVIITARKS